MQLASHRQWRWAPGAAFLAAFLILMVSGGRQAGPSGEESGWSSYGADPGGSRHSSLAQVTRENVARLSVAWTYRTGDATHDDHSEGPKEGCGRCHTGASKFETTPIIAEGRLYLSTPLNRVLALDPATGRELWRHDPKLKLNLDRNEGFVSRGVAYWSARGTRNAGRRASAASSSGRWTHGSLRSMPCRASPAAISGRGAPSTSTAVSAGCRRASMGSLPRRQWLET